MSPTFFLFSWFALPLLVWGGLLCYRRRVGLVWGWFVVLSSVVFGIFLLANYVWALDAQLLAEI
ncbi:MAG: hypothetical protein NXI32_17020, partial [bacterium]|nr:hypothetical protein [bacterium]